MAERGEAVNFVEIAIIHQLQAMAGWQQKMKTAHECDDAGRSKLPHAGLAEQSQGSGEEMD